MRGVVHIYKEKKGRLADDACHDDDYRRPRVSWTQMPRRSGLRRLAARLMAIKIIIFFCDAAVLQTYMIKIGMMMPPVINTTQPPPQAL